MEELKKISIRGRMAYILCMFEQLLLYYKCKKKDWCWIMKQLWKFTSIEYIDDWVYEVAEILPNSILYDGTEDLEYITVNQFYELKKIYINNPEDINKMMMLIFELGTMEIYTTIMGYSSGTILKLNEAERILKKNGIKPIGITDFDKYHFDEEGGWGIRFEGDLLSEFIKNIA